jgi:hypothetical protein
MTLLDLQGMDRSFIATSPDSTMSMSCVPESNVSMAMCDDDPDFSNLSVVLCQQ